MDHLIGCADVVGACPQALEVRDLLLGDRDDLGAETNIATQRVRHADRLGILESTFPKAIPA